MSKKISLEKEIDWLRTVITLTTAAVFGIFAWVAHNYKTADQMEMVVAALLFFLFLLSITMTNKKVYKNLKELEELED